MENGRDGSALDTPRRRTWFDDYPIFVPDCLWLGVGVYFICLAQGDRHAIGMGLLSWYVGYAGMWIWHVGNVRRRDPPGDGWRAGLWMAFGAAPLVAYALFWSRLTTWHAYVALLPIVFVLGVIAQIQAWRRPDVSPRADRLFLLLAAAAAVVFLACAGYFAVQAP